MALPAADHHHHHHDQPQQPDFLSTAVAIADRLCAEAIWHEDRCTWAGSAVEFVNGQWPVVWRTFGGDLYSGAAGVALFLTRLHRITGTERYQETALAAIRQALPLAAAAPAEAAFGLYSGRPGTALAAIETGDPGTVAAGREVMASLVGEDLAAPVVDVLAGDAGAIQGILNLDEPEDELVDVAVRLGDRLIDLAAKHPFGWSWGIEDPTTPLDLCGYAHGSGGIGVALLELHGATGHDRFRDAADQAFGYERRWFSPEHRNWPDLRQTTEEQAESGRDLVYPVMWCHGAGGIGLSRLRAHELTGDPQIREEARTALETTLANTTQLLQAAYTTPSYGGNFSYCHGLAGAAETLLYGWQLLGDVRYVQMAAAIGQFGAAVYQARSLPWPCGVLNGGETPSLMLGLAGIGHMYLRLHDPVNVPSVLIVTAAAA